MDTATVPRVLLVYYSHTQQSQRVAEVIADALRERGCDVSAAGIGFTDARYREKFSRFPFKHAVFDLLAVLPAQVFRKTGEISIPEAARAGDYDLVVLRIADVVLHDQHAPAVLPEVRRSRKGARRHALLRCTSSAGVTGAST